LVKLAQNQKSPFVQFDKKETATKFMHEVYTRVCNYGGHTEDEVNEEKIIDYGSFYIYLRDLADSVRPGGWLSNSTCELALHVLSLEMSKHKKHVMPLRLAVSYKITNILLFLLQVDATFLLWVLTFSFLSFFFPFFHDEDQVEGCDLLT
jgi:hypothetical protein